MLRFYLKVRTGVPGRDSYCFARRIPRVLKLPWDDWLSLCQPWIPEISLTESWKSKCMWKPSLCLPLREVRCTCTSHVRSCHAVLAGLHSLRMFFRFSFLTIQQHLKSLFIHLQEKRNLSRSEEKKRKVLLAGWSQWRRRRDRFHTLLFDRG